MDSNINRKKHFLRGLIILIYDITILQHDSLTYSLLKSMVITQYS